MNLFLIAWRNMQQRGFATLLTIFSMALGVTLVVLVLSVSWTITESFDRNSNVGYNLIVGARGGSLQLTLNSVFYLSKPIEVLPYEDYLDLLPGNERVAEIKRIGGRIADPEKAGEHSKFMEGGFAIPICLGDYFGPFRVVATKPIFFEKLRYGRMADLEYKFQEGGRNFLDHSPENGYFEAVLGSQVAAHMNKKVGDKLQTTHGDPDGEGHGQEFTIVGILEPTGTPNDRAAFINMEGFYLMDKHARSFVDPAHPDDLKVDVTRDPALNEPPRLPLHQRDVVAILVKPSSGPMAMFLEKPINKTMRMQAVSPIQEISNMLMTFVNPVKNALLVLTIIVCVVSALTILVSIYNSMSERRRDIAVMRALGARRDVVLLVVLLESLLIAIFGGAIGWFIGHGMGVLASGEVEKNTGIQISFFNTITIYEGLLIPGLMLLATFAGIIPAFVAYRTDVSKNLGS
jgi:putative ABC transport system permease protein